MKQHDGKDDETGVRIDPSKVFVSGVCSLYRMGSLYIECVLSVLQFLPGIDICTRIHCGVEVTELSTNKQHTLSLLLLLLCVCACECVCVRMRV